MADIELVMKLSEEDYTEICKCAYPNDILVGKLVYQVRNNTPLPKGHCKDCKWWKDKDGIYRRGIGAESECPINRREVFEGNGYCYLFAPQERSDKE